MAEEFDLHVYYFSDASIRGNEDVGFNQKVKWDIPLLEGYNYSFLKNISGRKSLSNRFWDVVNPSLVHTILKRKPSIVIVNGWSYFSNLLTIYTATILGKEVWLRAENPLNQELRKGRKVLFLKKIVLRYFLFPSIDRFLYIGSESKKFFEYYGIKSSKLIFTPYSVNNAHFVSVSNKLKQNKNLKNELGLPIDKTVILFTGKYIEKKRPLDLIRAFELLNDLNSVLVMVGEGILRKEMEKYITDRHLENIILTGFINQSEIIKYYASADIFVMCSGMGETWGLSVNEAMCFSLPVIVSSTCGSSADLVEQNVNGFIFPEGDINLLSKSLEILAADKVLRMEFGEKSLSIIGNYTNAVIVKNMKEAVE